MFLIALLSASQPLLLFAFFTYVHASTAYTHMPQIFTHCLPTIICVDVYRLCITVVLVCFVNLLNSSLFCQSQAESLSFVYISVRLIRHLQFRFWCRNS